MAYLGREVVCDRDPFALPSGFLSHGPNPARAAAGHDAAEPAATVAVDHADLAARLIAASYLGDDEATELTVLSLQYLPPSFW